MIKIDKSNEGSSGFATKNLVFDKNLKALAKSQEKSLFNELILLMTEK